MTEFFVPHTFKKTIFRKLHGKNPKVCKLESLTGVKIFFKEKKNG
jgi:hypothetical protein